MLRYSIPAGIVLAGAAYAVYEITRWMDDVTLAEARTAATITLLSAGLVVLIVVSRPLQLWKVALSASMAALYVSVLAIDFLRNYVQLDTPPSEAWPVIASALASHVSGSGWCPPHFSATSSGHANVQDGDRSLSQRGSTGRTMAL